MKRTKSLIGSIFGTIIHSIQTLINIYPLYVFFVMFLIVLDNPSAKADAPFALLFFSVLLIELISITALVLSCISFSYINKPHEHYAKRKGVTIALIVFNFILIALMLITFISSLGKLSILYPILYIICITLLLIANIFYIVDLSKEKHRIVQPQATESVSAVENEESTQNAE